MLGAHEPICVGESVEDFVFPFDARVVAVAGCADNVAGLFYAEDVGEAEVFTRLVALVEHAGFERGEERPAGFHVGAELVALRVA